MDGPSMTAIVNRVFDYKGSPLSDLAVTIRDGQVEQKGKLHKGVWIPFSVQATVAARPGSDPPASGQGSRGRYSSGEDDELFRTRARRPDQSPDRSRRDRSRQRPAARAVAHDAGARGARKGHLRAGRRRPSALAMGEPPAARKPLVVPDSNAANYIWFHGGRIQFGRLTMTDADLQLIDADEQDPFDFYSRSIQRSVRCRLFAEHAKRRPPNRDAGLRRYLPPSVGPAARSRRCARRTQELTRSPPLTHNPPVR